MISSILAVLDKVLPWIRRPNLVIEHLGRGASNMVNRADVSVVLILTVRNAGRAIGRSSRIQARTARGDGVALGLHDPRNPGDAVSTREGPDDVIVWQSVEPWPPSHTRQLECKLRMTQERPAKIRVTLTAPYMKARHHEVEVTWPEREPILRLDSSGA